MGKILSFNVESDNPYGEAFAVGAVVLNEEGEEIDRFTGIAEKDQIENRRVRETVLPVLGELREYKTRKEMRDDFWNFYMKHKENSLLVVDKGFSNVEGLFEQVIQEDRENRERYKPHYGFIYGVSSILRQKGIKPDINRIEYSGLRGLNQFNPADKALASAMVVFKAMNTDLKSKENTISGVSKLGELEKELDDLEQISVSQEKTDKKIKL